MNLDKLTPVSCSCDKCVNICRTAPCIGTREDILKLVKSGYGNRLFPTVLAAPIVLTMFGKPVSIVASKFENGKCTFLTEENKCELHDIGLKPTEGKITIHSEPTDINVFKQIIETWL